MVKASIIENILFKNENMLPYDQEYNQISAVGLGLDGSQLLFDFAGPITEVSACRKANLRCLQNRL